MLIHPRGVRLLPSGCLTGPCGTGARCSEAWAYIVRAMSMPGLAMPAMILRSLEAAALCRNLGLARKWAFWLRLAAIQSADLQNYHSAHVLGG
jgi:hypothetical protein